MDSEKLNITTDKITTKKKIIIIKRKITKNKLKENTTLRRKAKIK
jgi:hypothetical protein